MSGAVHHGRKPNGRGYIRKTELASGEPRYQARLGVRYLGTFEKREQAQRAIENAKLEERNSQEAGRVHMCHWPGCKHQVPPAMWGCKPHWFRLPKHLRDRIWATYVRGQEITMTPSAAYLEAADAVQRWIREHGGAA